MTSFIRDLIHFEEVEEVIKLRKAEQAQEVVEKYVISEGLQRNLLYMFELLSGVTHKSFNVVGNYGTGKSHLLAFMAALLEHPELRSHVSDVDVRAAAEQLKRRYLVVKFELGAAAEVSLRKIFFDQVYTQLLEEHDIEVKQINLSEDYDNKKNVLDILADIKSEDPEAGLVVIVDEISDFLKQKSKQEMSYDLALLRELGEVSQESDFLYIGAMQEHVFSDARYVDQAESIARVSQRFVTVTITKEDVAQVLTNRVVRKDGDQRLQLQNLLTDHKQYFTNLVEQLDRYVNLFPIHPYVIDIFEQLPYFENRGIIGFAVSNVKPILSEPAPHFITYDRVFDLINQTHEIRNLPDVNRVVNVIQTLQSKVDLLDARYRDDAKKLIKALAVLRLLGGDKDNGATSQELANTLFITPPGRLIVEPEMARDNIERIMKNIREVTVGQYINYAQNRYYLDLEKIDDYDAIIEKKAQAVVGKDEVNLAFRQIIEAELGFKEQKPLMAGLSIYDDTAPWPSHRAFRPGVLVIGLRTDGANVSWGDYRFVLQGPLATGVVGQTRQDEVVLAVNFNDELTGLLTRAHATELLAREGIHKKVMTKLQKEAEENFLGNYLVQLLKSGYAVQGGHQTPLSDLPASRPLNTLSDVVDHVKGALLDPYFADTYPNYPSFRTLITATNLSSEVARALQALTRMTTQQIDLNSRGYLESFGAIKDGQFSASHSPACTLILDRVTTNDAAGKVTAVDDLLREFARPPWGLPQEMVYLLLGTLIFNGYLIFVRQGGARLHAGDVGPLLKQGLEIFDEIRYLERDKDIDAEGATAIFTLLNLQPGLVRDKDSRTEAVKELREQGQTLKRDLASVRTGIQTILNESLNFPELPWPQIQTLQGQLAWLDQPLDQFASTSTVSALGKLDTSPGFRQTLQERLADLDTLNGFLTDWNDGLGKGLKHLTEAMTTLNPLEPLATGTEVTTFTDLRRIAADSQAIYSDSQKLLKADQRRPLKGKLDQFQQKYKRLYYGMHERIVGNQAPWDKIATLRQEVGYQALNRLKSLPFISGAEFNLLALELQTLEQYRCREFNAEVLDSFVACPYCRFPDKAASVANLPTRLQAVEKRLAELLDRWQEQLFKELPDLSDRLSLLTPARRDLIQALQADSKLPETISDALLAALQELASDLQPIDLDLTDLAQTLLKQGSALTVTDFRTALDDYLSARLKDHDPDLVRIKIVLPDSGT
ncbi:MAG: hypothetical protein KDJ65_05920 [Anaerolineae bacterium]|nr:hypothetical protein [Anaerolineae bacterium]